MRDFSGEIFYKTARSGGKGGQNVNKVETMAEAWWHIAGSLAFTPEEKELIQSKLQNRINKDGYLIVKASETRSQLENKQLAKEKMIALVEKAIFIPQQRKPTKISRAAKERRLESKKKDALKKQLRRKDY
ncbi:alternative ribosome rescue aminoacyl-tRNA hydrolase ArfB [Chitinophagaceae bacterium MMS25-I14]